MAVQPITTTPSRRGALALGSVSVRHYLALLGAAPALAILPSAAFASPANPILAAIERHRTARTEVNAAFKALDDLEFELAFDDWREPQALKYQCATWRGEEGEKVYVFTHADIDEWCDTRPSRIPHILLASETAEQIRTRMHSELKADAARQDAKRRANGHLAATNRLKVASEAEEAAHSRILTARPTTVAEAHALLTYATGEFDKGLSNSLCVVARNIAGSGALAA